MHTADGLSDENDLASDTTLLPAACFVEADTAHLPRCVVPNHDLPVIINPHFADYNIVDT